MDNNYSFQNNTFSNNFANRHNKRNKSYKIKKISQLIKKIKQNTNKIHINDNHYLSSNKKFSQKIIYNRSNPQKLHLHNLDLLSTNNTISLNQKKLKQITQIKIFTNSKKTIKERNSNNINYHSVINGNVNKINNLTLDNYKKFNQSSIINTSNKSNISISNYHETKSNNKIQSNLNTESRHLRIQHSNDNKKTKHVLTITNIDILKNENIENKNEETKTFHSKYNLTPKYILNINNLPDQSTKTKLFKNWIKILDSKNNSKQFKNNSVRNTQIYKFVNKINQLNENLKQMDKNNYLNTSKIINKNNHINNISIVDYNKSNKLSNKKEPTFNKTFQNIGLHYRHSGSYSNEKSYHKKRNNDKNLKKIIFIAKSNWGSSLKIGFNNIKLMDKNNKIIPILYSSFDINKPYLSFFFDGEIKKFVINYGRQYFLSHIIFTNSFNENGIKNLLILNEKKKVIWEGEIPKINMINHKPYYIYLYENYNYSKQKTEKNEKKKYLNFEKIKIKLIENYGNDTYIGLSGIEFYDENNKIINVVENSSYIKINQNIRNLHEKKILYNLFNNKNETTEPQYMFLTVIKNAFIEISFKQPIKVKKIIFYNYNNNFYKSSSTKIISMYFSYNNIKILQTKPLYLFLAPGVEGIDYGQKFIFPFNNYENIKNIEINKNKIIYNGEYEYYCPIFPSGNILKIELIDNWGNSDYISINDIKIFDINNKEINLFPSSNYSNINNIPKVYLFPEKQKLISNNKLSPFILTKFCGNNSIYLIFNNFIILSSIYIDNYNQNFGICAKNIKILLDEKIIFEGEIKYNDINDIYFKEMNEKTKGKYFNEKLEISSSELENSRRKINYNNKNERYVEYKTKDGIRSLVLKNL